MSVETADREPGVSTQVRLRVTDTQLESLRAQCFPTAGFMSTRRTMSSALPFVAIVVIAALLGLGLRLQHTRLLRTANWLIKSLEN